jgi:hypothetical protein
LLSLYARHAECAGSTDEQPSYGGLLSHRKKECLCLILQAVEKDNNIMDRMAKELEKLFVRNPITDKNTGRLD